MLQFIVAIDPRPQSKIGNFVGIAKRSAGRNIGWFFHAKNLARFLTTGKSQKTLRFPPQIAFTPFVSATFSRDEPKKISP
jgi:hypothetical protein